MSGRKHDVLIEDYLVEDERTGVKHKKDDEFILWADAGMKPLVERVEGVAKVLEFGTRYYVYVDHRYDIEYIKREVEAAILCADQK